MPAGRARNDYSDNGLFGITGGDNGKSLVVWTPRCCSATTRTDYPDNLPIVAAKGGPGGKPGCGSLPDVAKNCSRCVISSPTPAGAPGWTSGPTPVSGAPCYADFLPGHPGGARATEHSRVPGQGRHPDPIPYPGAPPYGAPLYGPDGTPLYPGIHRPATAGAGARHARRTAGGLRGAAATRPTGSQRSRRRTDPAAPVTMTDRSSTGMTQ